MDEILNLIYANGKSDNASIIEMLCVSKLVMIDDDGNGFLHHAVMNNNYDVVSFLLDEGVDPNVKNKKDDTPLHFSVCNGDHSITKMLLDSGSKATVKNYYGDTPIDLIAEGDNTLLNMILESM